VAEDGHTPVVMSSCAKLRKERRLPVGFAREPSPAEILRKSRLKIGAANEYSPRKLRLDTNTDNG